MAFAIRDVTGGEKPKTDTEVVRDWRKSELYRAMLEVRKRLLKGETSAVTEYRKRLAGVRKEIEAALAGVTGEEADSAKYERLRELLRQIVDVLNAAVEPGTDITKASQKEALRSVQGEAQRLAVAALGNVPDSVAGARLAGIVGPRTMWNRLPETAIQALIGFASDGSPLATVLRDAAHGEAETMRQLLVNGIALGKGPRAIARAMQGQLGKSYARFETIARTETLRSYREASRQSFEANRHVVKGYQRVAAGDARTCPACYALHGKVYQSSEVMHLHPNCRCAMVPLTPSWEELLGAGYGDIPDTRPTVPSAEQLFKRLSVSDRREVLGAERYALWQSGKAKLQDFARTEVDSKWGPTVRVATLAELGQ